jgi:hypothetical protein
MEEYCLDPSLLVCIDCYQAVNRKQTHSLVRRKVGYLGTGNN